MSTVGYLRVSTDQQSLDQQRDALTADLWVPEIVHTARDLHPHSTANV